MKRIVEEAKRCAKVAQNKCDDLDQYSRQNNIRSFEMPEADRKTLLPFLFPRNLFHRFTNTASDVKKNKKIKKK